MAIHSDINSVNKNDQLFNRSVNQSTDESYNDASSHKNLKSKIYFGIGLVALAIGAALLFLLYYHAIKNL